VTANPQMNGAGFAAGQNRLCFFFDVTAFDLVRLTRTSKPVRNNDRQTERECKRWAKRDAEEAAPAGC